MRDPDRIKRVCAILELAWDHPIFRDMRLGQLLVNTLTITHSPEEQGPEDIWNIEDDEWEIRLTQMAGFPKLGEEDGE